MSGEGEDGLGSGFGFGEEGHAVTAGMGLIGSADAVDAEIKEVPVHELQHDLVRVRV